MKTLGNIFAWIGNGLTYAIAFASTNQVFQIIEFAFSILTSLVIITLKIVSWFKRAKKDGKIDSDEVDELIDIISKEGDNKDDIQGPNNKPKKPN